MEDVGLVIEERTNWPMRGNGTNQRVAHRGRTQSPYLPTPFVPSYVSGHATVSGAAAEILAYFFPKDAGWLRDWAKTAARSRLYGGIQTSIENDTGLRLGQQVAGATLRRLRGVAFKYD
jgi:hypothetical protein